MEDQEASLEQRIVKSSVEMFVRNGIKAVSMDDVAKCVGISKRTLYEVFSSKDELLYRCIEYMNVEQGKIFARRVDSEENVIDIFFGVMRDFLRYSQEVSTVFWEDLARISNRPLNDCFVQNNEAHRQAIVDLLEKGKDLGLVIRDVDSDIFSVVVTTRNNIVVRRLIDFNKWTYADLMVHISGIFLRGIATPKGQELINERLEELKKMAASGSQEY